mmetsp:Transcript_18117/g.42314  ORF Transcript_18117/g.42314 Transcript_18117/m.42314 type:complete len:290 (-) Transcript_18117:1045-1914(-)
MKHACDDVINFCPVLDHLVVPQRANIVLRSLLWRWHRRRHRRDQAILFGDLVNDASQEDPVKASSTGAHGIERLLRSSRGAVLKWRQVRLELRFERSYDFTELREKLGGLSQISLTLVLLIRRLRQPPSEEAQETGEALRIAGNFALFHQSRIEANKIKFRASPCVHALLRSQGVVRQWWPPWSTGLPPSRWSHLTLFRRRVMVILGRLWRRILSIGNCVGPLLDLSLGLSLLTLALDINLADGTAGPRLLMRLVQAFIACIAFTWISLCIWLLCALNLRSCSLEIILH